LISGENQSLKGRLPTFNSYFYLINSPLAAFTTFALIILTLKTLALQGRKKNECKTKI
jgi:hypothetical protein